MKWTLIAALILPLGFAAIPAAAQNAANDREIAQTRFRYTYVHRRTFQYRTATVLTTCYCYYVSSYSFVQRAFQVGRYGSWNSAVAARNRYATGSRTCPGSCRRPMRMRAGTGGGGASLTARCRARYGHDWYYSYSRRGCVRTSTDGTSLTARCRARYGANYYYSYSRRGCVRTTTGLSLTARCRARYGANYYYSYSRRACVRRSVRSGNDLPRGN